jgi:transcriptional regulator with XRE-family HTH domain
MKGRSEKKSPPVVIELGRVIAAARTRRRLTQTDVALGAEIPISTYRRYENTTGPVKLAEAFAIADMLGVPLSELIREAEAGPIAPRPKPTATAPRKESRMG